MDDAFCLPIDDHQHQPDRRPLLLYGSHKSIIESVSQSSLAGSAWTLPPEEDSAARVLYMHARMHARRLSFRVGFPVSPIGIGLFGFVLYCAV